MTHPDTPKRRKRRLLGAAAGAAAIGAFAIATQSDKQVEKINNVPPVEDTENPADCAPTEAVKNLSLQIGDKVLRITEPKEDLSRPSAHKLESKPIAGEERSISDREAAISLLREVHNALQEKFPNFRFIFGNNHEEKPSMVIDDISLEGCRYVGEVTTDPSRGTVDLHYAHSSVAMVVNISGIEPFQMAEVTLGLQDAVSDFLRDIYKADQENPDMSDEERREFDKACRQRVKSFLLEGGYEFAMEG